jgi:uncharacterized protein (DUF3084 family)
MCGGIAYVGDLLGRRMGKKRLSIFGLRPRHTAIVCTVVTGMVIAAVTLGVLMLASAGVRVAVTRGEQLLHDNQRLRRERHELIGRNGGLEKTNLALAQKNDELRETGERLRTDTERLHKENGRLLARNRGLRERNTELASSSQSLTIRNRSLSAKNERLAQHNRRLTRTSQELLTANAGLKSRNRGLLTAQEGLKQARGVALEALHTTQGDLSRVRGDLKLARAELKQTQAEVKTAFRVLQETQELASRAVELEMGQMIVRRGEEVARRVLPAGASAATVRSTIRGLLADADAAIAKREGRAPGSKQRVQLFSRGAPQEQLLEALVMALRTESHPVNGLPAGVLRPESHALVLRALAGANATAGSDDPIPVIVQPRLNRLAFRRGEEVAMLEVETASTTGQLLKNLVAFLHRQVREAAVERSVLPDATGTVGEIDYESLLDVVGKVKRTAGHARIGAVAAADAWSAGPLRLDFYVVPVERPAVTGEPEPAAATGSTARAPQP